MSKEENFTNITYEGLQELRGRIGKEISKPEPYIEYATKDSIKHFAKGIGDYNPLWLDEEYAKKSRFGKLIGHPCMLYAFDKRANSGGPGLPGVHAMFAGTEWLWEKPVFEGDKINVSAKLKDVIEHEGEFAGRVIQQIVECVFYNQKEEIIAHSYPWAFRTERTSAKEKGKYKDSMAEPYYTSEDLEVIRQAYEKEKVRGSNPRYWEDVNVGDELDSIVRGPLTITDVIVFIQGWGGLYLKAHGEAFNWQKKHPFGGIPNRYGVPEPPERVHWDADFAAKVGVPGAYDYGPQRISWMASLLTNWCSDDGTLKRLRVELRRHVIIGDTIWCSGQLVSKSKENGMYLVEVDLKAINQRKQLVAKGSATIVLPTKPMGC